jgi:signal transduction histidine kinase/DNA-binding NarL/FixJ family response regulator
MECSHGAYPDAAGREDEWLAERQAAHVRKEGSLTQRMAGGRWLRITERETSDGGAVCVSVDITELKRGESQLRLAQAEAQAAAAVKAEFLANMSHELRTPLTSIIGFTGLANEQADLSELTRNYVDRVGDASRALLCTVNDILDFSKLEAGQVTIQPQPVSLRSLTSAALGLFTPQAGAKDLNLTLDDQSGSDDVVIALDPDRIRQILLNLVGNAVKFTKTGGVTLRTRYDPGVATLTIDVIDTGEGIPPDKQDRLFKRFSQVDGSLTRVQGGSGLGLAICKGLVEAMGGQIGVESRVGEGSRFWFTVPAPAATLPKPSSADAGADPTSVVGVRVLVADDHPTNRELARLVLTGVGAEITDAADGEEAARLASEWPFDVILMDLRMPKLDGIGALKRVRSRPGPNDATPILAFTADADAENRDRLAGVGFQGLVSKPIEPGALIAAVARAAAYAPSQSEADISNAAQSHTSLAMAAWRRLPAPCHSR